MKKVSISSWAIPQNIHELCKGAKALGFDGISLGGFPPYGANPDLLDTDEKIEDYKRAFTENDMEVADFAIDVWDYDALTQTDAWRAAFTRQLQFVKKFGLTNVVRFDTDSKPELPDGMTYAEVKQFYIKNFKEMAKEAAALDLQLVWEFEPGFIINEPRSIIEVCKAVNEPNFKLLFDTCHAYNCALGLNAIEPDILEGGVMEFIEMAKGLIGWVHVIDADGTLNHDNTSEHVPFGKGKINFDEVIPALMEVGEFEGEWWAIDLCEWPDAWSVAGMCKEYVDGFNEKYCD